ncbi:hypothetical protein AB1Y20_004655 [Prymnesium parvum]|uniref:G-protein coupled receptors family 1 profile domain-containing protein n=1 Tax=Prymnesium parvum TaxID=97485 RepID=A0AB34IWT9_PRYPA
MDGGVGAALICALLGILAGGSILLACLALQTSPWVSVRSVSLAIVARLGICYLLNGLCILLAALSAWLSPASPAAAWLCTSAGLGATLASFSALAWSAGYAAFIHAALLRATPPHAMRAWSCRLHALALALPLLLTTPPLLAVAIHAASPSAPPPPHALPWCMDTPVALLPAAFGGSMRGWRMLTCLPAVGCLVWVVAVFLRLQRRLRTLAHVSAAGSWPSPTRSSTRAADADAPSGGSSAWGGEGEGEEGGGRLAFRKAWESLRDAERRLGLYLVIFSSGVGVLLVHAAWDMHAPPERAPEELTMRALLSADALTTACLSFLIMLAFFSNPRNRLLPDMSRNLHRSVRSSLASALHDAD